MASIPLLRLTHLPTTTHHHKPRLSLLHHPLHHPFPTTLTTPKTPLKKPTFKITSSYTPTPATDRLITSLAYFLPFFNGLHYGRFLMAQYPSIQALFQPILPFFSLYKSLPYASFVSFFALYIGVVRNPSFSHFVRFNSMQALVLDVLLVLPLLLLRIFAPGGNPSGLGFKFMVMSHNFLFVFIVFCFVYGVVSCVLGKTPYLPLVADAAGRQL